MGFVVFSWAITVLSFSLTGTFGTRGTVNTGFTFVITFLTGFSVFIETFATVTTLSWGASVSGTSLTVFWFFLTFLTFVRTSVGLGGTDRDVRNLSGSHDWIWFNTSFSWF